MNVLFGEHAGGTELVRAVRGSRTSQVQGAGGAEEAHVRGVP
jgi:hypothetical protein